MVLFINLENMRAIIKNAEATRKFSTCPKLESIYKRDSNILDAS